MASGPLVSVQPRRLPLLSNRNRLALKSGIQNIQTQPQPVVDLLSSIINSQKFWHSKTKDKVTLKADGTFLLPEESNNNNNINNINKNFNKTSWLVK